MQKYAFTLVELIVVITILAVLGTIAFVSFQGYAKSSRDSARISDLKNIEKVLALYKIDTGFFPDADGATPITFSGSDIWSQGTFGETSRQAVKRISNIPTDPLTGTEYAYSTTYSKNEFQVGATFEGEGFAKKQIINRTIAGDRLGTSYVHGEYNGQLIQKEINGVFFILAVPTIINADMGSVLYQEIVNNGTFAVKGGKNLPDSYSGTVFNTLGGGNIPTVNSGSMILFSGNKSDLTGTDTTGRSTLLTNIQAAYTGTISIITNPSSIGATMAVDLSIPALVESYASSLVNNSLGANIELNNVDNTNSVIVNGTCGSDNSGNLTTTPTNLCSTGTASSVTDNGVGNMYTWNCNGQNGGTNNSCTANHLVIINGVCGTADGVVTVSMPSTNLCSTGNETGVIPNTGTYSWDCEGLNSGNTMNCSADRQYTVTFNGNSGTGHSPTSKNITYNTSVGTLPSNPTRTGYNFNGWFTASSGGSQITTGTVITGGVTYYAQWSMNSYTVTFNGNSGTGHSPTSKNITYNTSVGTLPSNPTRTGYSFNGWFTASSGGSQIITGTVITGGVTYYAQWSMNSYTVTFNGNSGTGHSPTSKNITYNTSVGTLPSNPTRTGYSFNGWFTASSGGSQIITGTVITGGVTYYAQWGLNGVCGAASKGYLSSDINYGSDTYCGGGSVTGGGTPLFPTEGGNTTWTCDGLNGGSISVQCEATRLIWSCGNIVSALGETYTTKLGPDGNCWTSQNMNHGNMLTNGTTMPSDIDIIEKWCYNNNTSNECDTDGGLYTWSEAMGFTNGCTWGNCTGPEDTSKSVCGQLGTGWGLPTNPQWYTLTDAGATGWTGNKLSGIVSSLSGHRSYTSNFVNYNNYGFWWSSTYEAVDNPNARVRQLRGFFTTVTSAPYNKAFGNSVVCIKN